jgi:DNA-directed RNA polymerase specialized sigma24 family protein
MLQGFFHHLFQRDFLSNVRREKGTFRSFLLQSLKNFSSDQREKARARKRGGGAAVASLDEISEDGRAVYNPASGEPGPDREFDRAWARMLLANSLAELEQECSRAGHAKLFASLEPTIASDATAQSYRDIGNRLGMTEAAVKTAAHRIRGRWKALIKQEVLQTVTNQDDWQREVRYLIGLFGE